MSEYESIRIKTPIILINSHLFPTQPEVEVLEVSQASAGEAGAAPEPCEVGQGGEVVEQVLACSAVHM